MPAVFARKRDRNGEEQEKTDRSGRGRPGASGWDRDWSAFDPQACPEGGYHPAPRRRPHPVADDAGRRHAEADGLAPAGPIPRDCVDGLFCDIPDKTSRRPVSREKVREVIGPAMPRPGSDRRKRGVQFAQAGSEPAVSLLRGPHRQPCNQCPRRSRGSPTRIGCRRSSGLFELRMGQQRVTHVIQRHAQVRLVRFLAPRPAVANLVIEQPQILWR